MYGYGLFAHSNCCLFRSGGELRVGVKLQTNGQTNKQRKKNWSLGPCLNVCVVFLFADLGCEMQTLLFCARQNREREVLLRS